MRPHTPEVKAAVMAALMAGQGICEVAKRYGIDKSTCSRWRAEQPEALQHVATQKAERADELLFTYLEETLTTLAVQARHFRDPAWLKEQHASELAILHGVQTDKAIRLLEALQRGAEEGEQSD
ncbi:MAG TPA: hypothetical protein VGN26_03985 [Armatimonadota bacterium]|jgi:transposase-like protein